MELPSTKPYLLRAIWEWCNDNGLTPHIAVEVDARTRVPREHIRDGQIVLNIGNGATHKLQLGNDYIEFQARFGGVARDLSIPIGQITAIYARENGAGMAFEVEDHEPQVAPQTPMLSEVVSISERDEDPTPPPPRPEGGRPKLQRIK